MDEEIFTVIVEKTKKVVLSAILRYLDNDYSSAIDDVVQETYIRAYKSLVKNHYRGDSKIETWLYVIAKNEAQRMNKIMQSQHKLETKFFEEINSQEGGTDYNEINEQVMNKINKLPLNYREVLKLYSSGKTENEIAKELSLVKGTVKSRLHRGKKIIELFFRGRLENE